MPHPVRLEAGPRRRSVRRGRLRFGGPGLSPLLGRLRHASLPLHERRPARILRRVSEPEWPV